ncbi:XVIPCD domain-containing protein [Variovorax sp. Sphag1AA]|uniref:XVIPCD domain-containing protein n=1 Tax=Variovorax sp. Sphag1AA TaxID=2587027 RepID=UPI0039084155
MLDAEVGRTPDQSSVQLACALVVIARSNGLDRIDQVALGTDASRVFIVQGASDSPRKRIANVPTIEALNTPIEQSSHAWTQTFEQSQQQDHERAIAQQHTAIQRQGPVMGL